MEKENGDEENIEQSTETEMHADQETNDESNSKETSEPVMEIEGIVQGEPDNNVVQSASRINGHSVMDDEDNKVWYIKNSQILNTIQNAYIQRVTNFTENKTDKKTQKLHRIVVCKCLLNQIRFVFPVSLYIYVSVFIYDHVIFPTNKNTKFE